ncbi:phage tail terminator protein [Dyella telluris]|uniref:Uncharacterized protein n=1 Tax=Dyella telluris TaxID=2763498 RepID=A0A7G8Q4F8_9GAMM|nr:minor capsid protein [Dyella telluris]QNK01666.1 hypothetical protein H8F01_00350 [Dyella telluris]
MILEAVAAILTEKKHGIPTKTLFIHNMPEKIRTGVLIMDDLMGTERDDDIPDLKRTPFKVVVRDTDYSACVKRAEAIVRELDIHRRIIPDQLEIKRMRATHDPITFPDTPGDMIEMLINLQATWAPINR